MMAVSEDDVADLCRMEICMVKDILRPDTLRIGTAFDDMMTRVKVRSS